MENGRETLWCPKFKQICNRKITAKNTAFIIMSYRGNESDIIENIIRNAIKRVYRNSIEVILAKDIKVDSSSDMLCDKICIPLRESLFCLADVTYDNTNVGFEIGLCWKFEKRYFIYTYNEKYGNRKPSDFLGAYFAFYKTEDDLSKKLIKNFIDYSELMEKSDELIRQKRPRVEIV